MADTFSTTKPIYVIGKLFSSVLHSVHGQPKSRYLKITYKDMMYFLFTNIVLTYVILCNVFEMARIISFERDFLVITLVIFGTVLLFAVVAMQNMFFYVIYRKKIIEIWIQMNKLHQNFNKKFIGK